MSGWICLHRDIQNHWIFKDAEHFRAWVDLIMLANHEKKKFQIKGQIFECDRGQVGFSQLSLSERWGWSRNRVKRFIDLLEKDGMILYKSGHLNTVITICNYSLYQDIQEHDGAPLGAPLGAQTTIKQLNNENKKETCTNVHVVKKSKNSETLELLLQYSIAGQLALDFIEHRKHCGKNSKGAPITATVMNGFKKQAELAGIEINEAIEISIQRGWQGFNASWYLDSKQKKQNQTGGYGKNGNITREQWLSLDF